MKRSEAVDRESDFLVSIRPEKEPEVFWNGYGIANMLSYVCDCTPDQALDALHILKRLGDMATQIRSLRSEVNDLYTGPRCCGHKWQNNSGRVYMHHALNEGCPMHGKAPAGSDRGLRSYVKAEDVESTLAAAANFELWKIRTSELRQLENKRDYAAMQLKNMTRK